MFHLQARLEDDYFTWRDRTLSPVRDFVRSALSFLDLEYAEIAELNFLGAYQTIHDNVKVFCTTL